MVNDEAVPWHAGMTLADLIRSLPDGDQYAVVKVSGRYVSKPDFAAFRVPDQAKIYLIPMVAGG
jgi:thiamine biosynthesis protein ThiS